MLAAGLGGCSLFDKRVDVLYIGDSIMAQTGPYAESYLVEQPGVGSAKTYVDATNGTGLLTPRLRDWLAEAPGIADRYQPKVVVILFIGNYTNGTDPPYWKAADGTEVPNDYPDRFFAEWLAQAEKLNAVFTGRGAQVDWVLPPPMAGPEGERRATGMRATYEQLQARIPTIGLIDGTKALGGNNGEWVWMRPGVDGGEVIVRAADSVHLTEAGGRLMAREMAQTVAPQLQRARAATT